MLQLVGEIDNTQVIVLVTSHIESAKPDDRLKSLLQNSG
jgi:hypothetical protein